MDRKNTLFPLITPLMADRKGSLLNVVKRCCYGKTNYYTLVKIPFRECYIAAILFYFEFLNFILFIFLNSRLLVIYFIHISAYMSNPISHFIPPPPPPPTIFPPWCPYVCSLHLCLYFCPANWFICTIFLGSTYMR